MKELLMKIINEDAAKKEIREFKIVESNGTQFLVLVNGYGEEISRTALDANSACATCPHYVGACVCNCPGVG